MEEEKKDVDVADKSVIEPGSSDGKDIEAAKAEALAEIERLKQEAENLKEAKRQELEELRELRERKKSTDKEPDDDDDDSDGWKKVEKISEKHSNVALDRIRMENEEIALRKFYEKHPEYSPEKDQNNVLFGKLKSVYSKVGGGSISSEKILLNLEESHRIAFPKKYEKELSEKIRKEEKIRLLEDSNADTGSTYSAGKDRDAKPLTSEQKKAAKKGGLSEEEYRKYSSDESYTLDV